MITINCVSFGPRYTNNVNCTKIIILQQVDDGTFEVDVEGEVFTASEGSMTFTTGEAPTTKATPVDDDDNTTTIIIVIVVVAVVCLIAIAIACYVSICHKYIDDLI